MAPKNKAKMVQYPLWPNTEGLINLPKLSSAKQTDQLITSPSERRESYLQLSLPLPRAPVRERLRGRSFIWSRLWLSLKLQIAFSTHRASRPFYNQWLLEKVDGGPYGAIDVNDAVESAVGELGLDREKAIRYLIQATRLGGPVKSDGDIITRK